MPKSDKNNPTHVAGEILEVVAGSSLMIWIKTDEPGKVDAH
jgi:hypothetical protein